jgi:hypothetical protein
VTAKRIYFNARPWITFDLNEHFVDRAAIESTGETYHRGIQENLSLVVPAVRPNSSHLERKSIAELRREMANCHPDVGGDPVEFRAAHGRYVAAKAVTQ